MWKELANFLLCIIQFPGRKLDITWVSIYITPYLRLTKQPSHTLLSFMTFKTFLIAGWESLSQYSLSTLCLSLFVTIQLKESPKCFQYQMTVSYDVIRKTFPTKWVHIIKLYSSNIIRREKSFAPCFIKD